MFLLPSPLVGGWLREAKTGEGFVSADRDPSSGADFIRATFSHKGRREEVATEGEAAFLIHP
jgi:hypothetical protein